MKLRTIGKNRTILGISLLTFCTVAVVVAVWSKNEQYVLSVIPPALLAFGQLVGREDDRERGEKDGS